MLRRDDEWLKHDILLHRGEITARHESVARCRGPQDVAERLESNAPSQESIDGDGSVGLKECAPSSFNPANDLVVSK